MSLSHFDEKSGIIAVETEWGRWWQTISEIFIEINIESGTSGKECKVIINPRYLECQVRDRVIFKGPLYKTVIVEECTWTVEGREKIMILLEKSEKFENQNIWLSLLEGQYAANLYQQHEMMKKLDLEKFQIENPGFDFSGAQLSKVYDKPSDVCEGSQK